VDITRIPLERETSERLQWFIKFRWIAGGGLTVLALLAPYFIPEIPMFTLLAIAAAILVYNAFFYFFSDRFEATFVIHSQVVMDWIALTVLCHQTGGLDSPFILFYVFHIILISMLTNRLGCFIQGVMSIILVSLMVLLEKTGTWSIPQIPGFTISTHHENIGYIVAFLSAFAGVILFSIYLMTSIVQRLRQREEELLKLQQSVSKSYEELVQIDRAKTQFVQTVTHEIRGPMAATQSLIRVVLDGYAGEINDKVRGLLTRAERRIIRLLELVNELLDLVRGGQRLPEEDKADINVYDSISRILRHMEGRAEEKNISLNFRMPHTNVIFRGDQQDLERIFQNLVGNAIKYTPEGGHVKVLGRLRKDNFLLFKVCDTGIGVPEKEIPRVFDDFFRATNAKRKLKGGTGLGLSIVKKTITKYGGHIKVVSKMGKGSCFSVYLPAISLDA